MLKKMLNIKEYASYLQTGEPSEDEYPPLPVYQPESEKEKKEVFIVQVKGLPWSCTSDDLLKFFSGN